jgi:hypothetical protein
LIGEPNILSPRPWKAAAFSKTSINVAVFSFSFKNYSNLTIPDSSRLKKSGVCSSMMNFLISSIL